MATKQPTPPRDEDGTDVEDGLQHLPPGAEVDDSELDDNERDEIALAEQAAIDAGQVPPSREDILATLREGMHEAGGGEPKPADGTDGKAEGEPKPDDGVTPPAKVEPAPGTDEALKAAEEAETARKAAVDKEADKLGLKGKSRDRFHELNRQVAEITSINEGLSKLAGNDKDGKPLTGAAAVAQLTENIKRHIEFEDTIFASGVTGEDFRNVAGYKFAINSADPKLWSEAAKFLRTELDWLECDKMGIRQREGDDKAYEKYDDLREAVETGETMPKFANELAAQRNLAAKAAEAQTTHSDTTAKQQAENNAANECATFASSLAAQDNAQFVAKWPQLEPKLKQIQKDFPPAQWRDRMELEYHRIAYAPAAPAAGNTTQPPQQRQRAAIRPGALPRAGARRPAAAAAGVERSTEGESAFDALKSGMFEAGGGEVDA